MLYTLAVSTGQYLHTISDVYDSQTHCTDWQFPKLIPRILGCNLVDRKSYEGYDCARGWRSHFDGPEYEQ
jgi:hypothetical protein